MKHLSLAARYRPQTFAQVAGQDTVKAVLSRAAAEGRPAPAYLLSGTRGVGKTTIARIFAKALNCERGPAAEPCNQCEQCRKITQGAHVDVAEIDGASNNSVEDVRALRENIGYAPMEGRYKIFIVDEAHMLSRNAFNALLKTLEEPPENVVFIFATTEAHKFPITIVSRCQHFVFRHLSEDALAAHLSAVLHKENVPFEEGAVRCIARRAAGSVRDGMSLLDQTLALGEERLTVDTARRVLGLAGQEFFAALFTALREQDCAAVADLCARLLQEGADIGFFVRELAGHWRNLFLLRQGGNAILPSLRLPPDDAALWQNLAPRFAAAHLHAAWQMTLDAQRGIVQSPEPAAALELLLLNLALLPQLLPVEQALPLRPSGAAGRSGADAATADAGAATRGVAPQAPPSTDGRAAATGPSHGTTDRTGPRPAPPAEAAPGFVPGPAGEDNARPRARQSNGAAAATEDGEAADGPDPDAARAAAPAAAAAAAPPHGAGKTPPAPALRPANNSKAAAVQEAATDAAGLDAGRQPERDEGSGKAHGAPEAASGHGPAVRDWTAFCDFCTAPRPDAAATPPPHLLRGLEACWQAGLLELRPRTASQAEQLERRRPGLEAALAAYGLPTDEVRVVTPAPRRPEAELIAAFSAKPELRHCLEVLNARVGACKPLNNGH